MNKINRKSEIIKKIFVLLIFFSLIMSIFSNVMAMSMQEMEEQVKKFHDAGEKPDMGSEVYEEFAELGSILTTIGAGVMVGVTAYMGIKYLTSGPEAQAKLKTQLIGVLVSGIVIFGAYYIWKIVINVSKTL